MYSTKGWNVVELRFCVTRTTSSNPITVKVEVSFTIPMNMLPMFGMAIFGAATMIFAADSKREQTLQRGIDLLESKGDLAKAMPLFEEASHSWDKAVAACRQAGTNAITHSAYREAVTYFEQALSALHRLPASPDTQAQAIDLRVDLRRALFPLGEIERIFVCLQEAQTLAEALGWATSSGWGGSLPG